MENLKDNKLFLKQGKFYYHRYAGEDFVIAYKDSLPDNLIRCYFIYSLTEKTFIQYDVRICKLNIVRLATEAEKMSVLSALNKIGKGWNMRDKCLYDISGYKDGEFYYYDSGFLKAILIFKTFEPNRNRCHYYVLYSLNSNRFLFQNWCDNFIKRPATKIEKLKLIEALNEKGKDWDEDNKQIIDLPRYKPGDICYINAFGMNNLTFIKGYSDKHYDCQFLYDIDNNEITNDPKMIIHRGNIKRLANDEEKKMLLNKLCDVNKELYAINRQLTDNPYKDGDIYYCECQGREAIAIFKERTSSRACFEYHAIFTDKGNLTYYNSCNYEIKRFATEKEKEAFLNAIRQDNKMWVPTLKKFTTRVEDGKFYWYVDQTFSVTSKYEYGTPFDDTMSNNGNYFLTSEEAQEYADKVKDLFNNK